MKKMAVVALTGMMLCLTGCGSVAGKYDANTLIITKDNTYTDVSVEDYTGLDVTKEDLQSYVEKQISTYQADESVKLDELTLEKNTAKLVMSYQNIEVYNAVNGTAYQAVEAGSFQYSDQDVKGMVSPDDGALDETAVSELLQKEDARVLVLSADTDVVVKGKLLAYKDAEYENGTLHAKDGSVIVYK